MSNDMDAFWEEVAPELERALGFSPFSLEEADARLAKGLRVPLTEQEIESMVAYATGKTAHLPEHRSVVSDSDLSEADAEFLEPELLALYRNQGDEDPDVDAEIERMGREALDEEDEDDDEGTK